MNAIKDKTFLVSIGSAIGVCFFLVGLTYNVTNWKRDIEEAQRELKSKHYAFEVKCDSRYEGLQEQVNKIEDMFAFLFEELDIHYQKKTS